MIVLAAVRPIATTWPVICSAELRSTAGACERGGGLGGGERSEVG